ncbi:MAG: endonuclease/exonuclease/phosphatase family protein [Pseudomonadales bacterium]|nr:endonuclease/exonuclease/phosphatase family protein [Pseudomonadales bacterium]
MKIISISLDGLVAAAEKGFFKWMVQQDADVICIQGTGSDEYELADALYHPEPYFGHFYDAVEPGKGGVAIYCKQQPRAMMRGFGHLLADIEGRYMQADYDDVSIVSVAIPEASNDEARQIERRQFMDKLLQHLIKIRNKRREFILCGDFQVAHLDIDSLNAESDDNFCFDEQDREWLDDVFDAAGYNDAFREVNDQPNQYSWHPSQDCDDYLRDAWRVDYQIITNSLSPKVEHAEFDSQTKFSSHLPLIIEYSI